MKKLLTIFLTFTLLLYFSSPVLALAQVPENSPYREAINFLQDKGLINQTVPNFEPKKLISRQDFIKWSFDLFGFTPKTTLVDKFPCLDLPSTSPFMVYFYEAMKIGLLPEIKNHLCQPTQPISKIAALEKLFFLNGIPSPRLLDSDSLPKDVKSNSRLAPLIHKAIQAKIITLDQSQLFKPYQKLNRKEAADILFKMYRYLNQKQPADQENDTVTIFTAPIGQEPSYPADIANIEVLLNVLKEVKDKYYFADQEKITGSNIVYKTIDGLIKELNDPFSAFDEPNTNVISGALEGNFEGIGIRIFDDKEAISILNIIKSSPAAKSGLKAKDVIKKINGEDTTPLKIEEIVKKIRGPAGTSVKLEIFRPETNETLEFDLVRTQITVTQVESKILEGNIAYIAINIFGENTITQFEAELKNTLKPDSQGLIIDLRDNPGGYLNTVVKILEHFIPKGEAVAHIKNRYGTIKSLVSQGQGELVKYPLIILINKSSASAAEIFAGALQDYKLGKIIGVTTFGKGTVQELIYYTDGSGLKLTVYEWLLPSKRSINQVGVTPDIVIDLTTDELKQNRDPQLARAIEELKR